ncbi:MULTISPECIES: hydantoinase B/oxoprolinase family protein [unclassified Chelatococcus]|uniref:hydantoinase B/oxoprolinase family protein n=2 Tax=Chelatococcus TaxID=28209 RepID=UPI001BCE5CC0|nr:MULTISPECIES: hydantoinase B/oxoprolinase family protein [unclassified Chelatococcus]MBS7743417.1 hydantoinase B/oxoprolinase family protein [Chelatococcus sp. HY11]CAH1649632.1 N-methylhydantoinase B [Hyphomicrobiales bacterium]CAH1692088.1 N-methylhydantoinase B [Hyphomicrobiales bacterium]
MMLNKTEARGDSLTIDPITLEVIRNRLDVVAAEMEGTLIRSAFSVVLKEGADCSCALFTVSGDTMAQSVALPQHLGVLAATVKSLLRAFPPETMEEGDVYIMNDPYDGGTHLPDITALTPVFSSGRCVAMAASMAHHSDLGGMAIGSLPPDATELFQEGIVLPPVKLIARGVFDEQIRGILLKNVRMPAFLEADLGAQFASIRIGAARFAEICQEFGEDTVLAYIDELMDRSEALTRARITEIPDGSYTFIDYIDNDGIVLDKRVKIQATLTIKGSDIHVDFAGTDPQVAGAANAAFSHAACVTYYCVRCITDPRLPNNAGCFRPISVSLPEGTLVNPRHPAPVNARTMTVCRMTDVIFGCLAQAAPERVRASSSGMQGVSFSGRRASDGRAYVYLELFCGGMGARPTKDGVDYIETDITNMMNAPTEAVELEYPLRIHSMRLKTDSGGAGLHRGGLGMRKVFEVVEGPLEVTHRGDRHFSRPWGLKGGRPAMPWSSVIKRTDGSEHKVPARERFTLRTGDILVSDTAGGGGYGDPLSRPAARVANDVAEAQISLPAARADYGVVLDEALHVDAAATEALRARMATARGAITWTFDRGEDGRD